ncbi:hypothetical protein ACSC9U_28625 [Pseudomonas solani]|uniref:hypothetical protein n=1 Tax=Pseudomonas solani TaxID=2731552 RepID=UPI003F4AF2DF
MQDELIEVPADNKAYRILRFMVQAKLADLDRNGHEPQQFSRSALLLNVEGEHKGKTLNATTWLSPGLLEHFLNSRLAALCERLRRAGLDQMPVVRANDGKGGKGNERTFWLDVSPLADASIPKEQHRPWTHIEYSRTDAGSVRPSWLLRLIFRNGELKNRSWRGLSLLVSILIGILLLGLWLLAGMWTVATLDQTLTLLQLGKVALLGLGGWFIWANFYAPWWRLVDDRVIKAPAALLSIFEDSAELEMHRDSEGQQWTRFVRFSGDCPICSGRVLLMPGKPDQVLPIVGRCIESPYAHVYSFDRARLSGSYIGPELSFSS